ncbi:hypothetical protein GOBAR_AA27843 [Gossypium barbadense]|uniref:Uncharacterized protein n=1 Tax=Gossypium barbadense TaxID=3634 RepID=A0A2P5WP72_GOSBA|nr:hypothetical protein GOBAR_AA27843 [Gossypium barbadense]
MELVRLKCEFENGIDIEVVGSKGGLSLGWKENYLVSLRSFSSSHNDVDIHDHKREEVWHLTSFYGDPDGRFRCTSWDLLRQLCIDPSILWVVLGDSNKITNSYEK